MLPQLFLFLRFFNLLRPAMTEEYFSTYTRKKYYAPTTDKRVFSFRNLEFGATVTRLFLFGN